MRREFGLVVGSQVNHIRALFKHYGHREGLDLLDRIEDECCLSRPQSRRFRCRGRISPSA
ncbi:N(2)-fixation sustaining protein CowN [Thermochromatium tepidum]|uniref:N(2)-fixation sustaining protein CowN n=1 Tax=Thermochromatium tepidum TaxID=1050 RepID=UPI0031B5710F